MLKLQIMSFSFIIIYKICFAANTLLEYPKYKVK